MKISIENPCHENWSNMTPEKTRAFCHSCVKSVIDFSEKSLEEIKSFFSSPKEEKVCGRFKSEQLQAMEIEDFLSRFKRFRFSKKIILIILLVFGFWFFKPIAGNAQSDIHVKGEIAPLATKDTSKTKPKKDTLKVNTTKTIKGKVKCDDPKGQTKSKGVQKSNVSKREPEKKEPTNQHLLGDVYVEDRNR